MSHGKYKAFSKDSPGAEKVLKVEYTWKKKKKCTEVQDQRLLALRFLLYRLKLSYIVTSRKQKLIIHIYKKEVIENTVLVQSVEFQLKKR